MYTKFSNLVIVRWRIAFIAALLSLMMSINFLPACAANLVDVTVTTESGLNVDTLYVGMDHKFRILVENDIVLNGMSLGFEVWSPDGATWQWNNRCDSWMGQHIVCPVPGSRADGLFLDFVIIHPNIDEAGRDTIMAGGMVAYTGIPTGPLEPFFDAFFTPIGPDPDLVYTFCIDSAFIPPSGAFVFLDTYGTAITPTVLWEYGGKCFPVSEYHCLATWDEGLPTEMTVSYCGTNSLTLSAASPTNPVDFSLYQQIGGNGEASVTDNGDGTCEVSYTGVPEDLGQEITIEINAVCEESPGGRGLYSLSVNVLNLPPVLDSGFYYKYGATENPVTKDDIGVIDPEVCDDHEYFMVTGPGEIDPITGVYYWLPGPTDTGYFLIEIGVTDGNTADTGSFEVALADQACCPGDVNYTGAVNVGDAMSLINYIFKGGHAPFVINWADPNADCQVNVGDVIYLINYVFRSGPDPLLGCVY